MRDSATGHIGLLHRLRAVAVLLAGACLTLVAAATGVTGEAAGQLAHAERRGGRS